MHKLLIADGSPTMHRIIELTFAREPFQVIGVTDGDQALALLPIARPDIVIADHALGGRNGYEIADFVRQHAELSKTPVLLLAGAFEPVDRQRAEAAGVAGEITKPFDPAQLVARVQQLLAPPPPPPAAPAPVPTTPASPEPGSGETTGPALKLVDTAFPSRGALDDYFDRLDAALQRLDDQMSAAAADDRALPTVDSLLAPEYRSAGVVEHPLRGVYGSRDRAASAAPGEAPEPAVTRTADKARADEPMLAGPTLDEPTLDEPTLDEPTLDEPTLDEQMLAEPMLDEPVADERMADDRIADKQMADEPRPAGAGAVSSLPGATADLGALLESFRATREEPRPAAPVVVSDELVDEVTRRVLARLAPDAADRLVAPLVSQIIADVAERLVAEALARLREPPR